MSELTKVVVDAISLVKAGANEEPIQIYKAADGQSKPVVDNAASVVDNTEPTSGQTSIKEPKTTAPVKSKDLKALFEPFAKALGFNLTEKSTDIDNSVEYESFTSRMTRPSTQISDALYTLNDCLWEIFWNDQISNGREIILQNIDEFKTYVTQVLDSNKERQTEFFTKGETEVTKSEVQDIIKTAMEPALKSVDELTKRIEAIGKEETPAPGETTPAAGETTPAPGETTPAAGETTPAPGETTPAAGEPTPAADDNTTEIHKSDEFAATLKSVLTEVLEPVSKSLKDMNDRVDTLENTRGLSNGLQPSSVHKSVVDEWPEFNLPGV